MTMRIAICFILLSTSLLAHAEQTRAPVYSLTEPVAQKTPVLAKKLAIAAQEATRKSTPKPTLNKSDDFTSRPEVQAFIDLMVKKHDFNRKKLVTLFKKVSYRQSVLDQIKKPLEKETWDLYQRLFVSEWRIQNGVKFWNKYADVLRRAEKTYGVPASIIVATIGVETRYGKHTGDYRVIDSLSSLAFSDSRRAPFFRNELEQFLLLTREQKQDPLNIYGSYAGAIGQPQFMPSSYRNYAVNFSKSGKIDLMNDEVDVIGSIANYYSKHGWKLNHPVAVQAKINSKQYQSFMKRGHRQEYHRIQDLAKYGFKPTSKIKDGTQPVKVIELDGQANKEYWLSYQNFNVIKRYNPSDLYAMAVYQLSHYITELRNLREHR